MNILSTRARAVPIIFCVIASNRRTLDMFQWDLMAIRTMRMPIVYSFQCQKIDKEHAGETL